MLVEFRTVLASFIATNPTHGLSPKFASLLSKVDTLALNLASALPDLVRRQRNLEDVAYATSRFIDGSAASLVDTERAQFLVLMTDALVANLHKPYSELCVLMLIRGARSRIHFAAVASLFQTYLKAAKQPDRESNQAENLFWKVIQTYRNFEVNSGIEIEIIQENIAICLSILQSNARRTQSARYFKAILETWPVEAIPRELSTETLREIIREMHPDRWGRAMSCMRAVRKLFGGDLPIVPDLSLEYAISVLEFS